MRAVIQRVTHASVTIEGKVHGQIGHGFLILLGVCDEDSMEDVDWLVKMQFGSVFQNFGNVIWGLLKPILVGLAVFIACECVSILIY